MKDIALNNDFTLKIANGDFVIEESDNQHVALLAGTSAGEWKQSPVTGMGLNRFLKGDSDDLIRMKHIINIQLKADGAIEQKVIINQDTIQIDAKY
jgi:hypothetical protein